MSTETVMVNWLINDGVVRNEQHLNDRVKMRSVDRGALGNSPTWGASSALRTDSIGIEDRKANKPGLEYISLAVTGRISRSVAKSGTQHPGLGKSFPGVTPLGLSILEKFENRESSKELSLGNTWGDGRGCLPRVLTSILRGHNTRGKQDGNTKARADQFEQLGSSF